MLGRTFDIKHSVSLRMPIEVLDWLIAKSTEADLPVATYTVRRLKELARQDLVKGEQDGDLHSQAG